MNSQMASVWMNLTSLSFIPIPDISFVQMEYIAQVTLKTFFVTYRQIVGAVSTKYPSCLVIHCAGLVVNGFMIGLPYT